MKTARKFVINFIGVGFVDEDLFFRRNLSRQRSVVVRPAAFSFARSFRPWLGKPLRGVGKSARTYLYRKRKVKKKRTAVRARVSVVGVLTRSSAAATAVQESSTPGHTTHTRYDYATTGTLYL